MTLTMETLDAFPEDDIVSRIVTSKWDDVLNPAVADRKARLATGFENEGERDTFRKNLVHAANTRNFGCKTGIRRSDGALVWQIVDKAARVAAEGEPTPDSGPVTGNGDGAAPGSGKPAAKK